MSDNQRSAETGVLNSVDLRISVGGLRITKMSDTRGSRPQGSLVLLQLFGLIPASA